MRVLVCGGRDYMNQARVDSILASVDAVQPISIIIEGGAVGADRWARLWGESNGIHVATVKANWDKYKLAAGPRRNIAMLKLQPEFVIAFPGGKGTADMMRRAKEAKVRILKISDEDNIVVREVI